jgi:hypothetical protein
VDREPEPRVRARDGDRRSRWIDSDDAGAGVGKTLGENAAATADVEHVET